ncbi:MAG: dynamin family protein [Bacillaceae bacterium]
MLMGVKEHHVLSKLYEEMEQNGEKENSYKIKEFSNKIASNKVQIAFCGHFSAGKSSFINELFGSEVLPTSPIPTSANVVFVEKGTKNIQLSLHDNTIIDVPAFTPIEEVKKLCTTGEYVKYIRYYCHEDAFFDDVVLIDTPGVDSVDAAHALATQSALHLADVIFYMMDYNHVGSQSNLDFMKELTERNKRLYIIINQIDKHIETELSFETYRQDIKAVFESAHIQYEQIYYTSLKEKDMKENELDSVKMLIEKIRINKDKLIADTLQKELIYLINQYATTRLQQHNEEYEGEVEIAILDGRLHELEIKQQTLQREVEEQKKQLEKEIDKIAENAYVITPNIRDDATSFLEGMNANFKVGLFFTKEKTEKEQKKRLQTLCSKLQETVVTQLVNHLQFVLEEQEKKYHISLEPLVVEDSFLQTTILNTMKKDAVLSSTYVINYCNDLAYELKKNYKKKALEQLEDVFRERTEEISTLLLSIEGEKTELTQRKKEYEKWKQRVDEVNAQQNDMITFVKENGNKISTVGVPSLQVNSMSYEVWKKEMLQSNLPQLEKQEKANEEEVLIFNEKTDLLENVEAAIPYFQKVAPLQTYVDALKQKITRLQNKTYTLALFGAFSAGKSSFANALVGEKILPSSPNPTTATVIKITRATKQNEHGSVVIYFKEKAALLEEWSSLCGTNISAIEDILHVNVASIENESDRQYVKRIQQQLPNQLQLIGTKINRQISNYEPYVKDEKIACFVKEAIIYYDCEFTLKNIMIVDTPGADSVYSRHTNVSFQYMKHSDGILFVTYYNHAFSKSDRELLIQLGKVKDLSKIDTIFFLINAIDLCSDVSEGTIVKEYVEQQLLSYGIKQPRLFSLSSKQALRYKQGKEDDQYKFSEVEQRIYSFVLEELYYLSLQDMVYTLENMRGILTETMRIIDLSDSHREQQLHKWEQNKLLFESLVKKAFQRKETEWLKREIYELMYYVEKRIFDRYYSFFNESFNPSVFTKQKGKEDVLKECLIDFCDTISDALHKDVQVTSYRIEKYITKMLHEQVKGMNERAFIQETQFQFVEETSVTYTDYAGLKPSLLEGKRKEYERVLKKVKDTKWFFEKNGKKDISEQVKELIKEEIHAYIERERMQLLEQYEQQYQLISNQHVASYIEQVYQFVTYMQSIIQVPINKIDVQLCQEMIANLLKK